MTTKSKFFRVAVEGATTDGRNIDATWIEQMAKNFNRETYGARVWLEHYRGIAPDGLFKAYGDVLALKAEKVDIKGQKKLALFAQIEPLPDLVTMTKAKQKIYTSIEVNPKFSDTGEAYLTGLAVTDSPASLGTEVLSFAQQKPDASPFAGRKSDPAALFSEAIEADIQFEEVADVDSIAAKFSSGLKSLTDKLKGKGKADDSRFADVMAAFEQFCELAGEQADQLTALRKEHATLASEFKTLQTAHADLVKKLEATTAGNHTTRPAATGGKGIEQTDC
ncbi:MAG: GPO family capsid scaffolding protein [Rhodoferax sp.]